MKVLVISAAFPPMRAGEGDHALHLCEHLADNGLDVHVLTTKGIPIAQTFRFKVYPIMRKWGWSDLPRLAMILRRCSPDAVLLLYSGWIYNGHPMITFAATLSKILLPSTRFVTQFETEYVSRRASILTRLAFKTILRWAMREYLDYFFGTLLRDSDHIIALSERHRLEFLETHPSLNTNITVIPPPPIMPIVLENNGTSRQRGREALRVNPDDFVVAYFGYIYLNKGIETLLKAFQILASQRSHVRLIMIGGSSDSPSSPVYLQKMYVLSQQLGIDDKVTWTGNYAWNSDEASLYLHAADACVLPFDNGVALNRSSLAAATAHGLPIVTTKGKILESPFIDQENVLLCRPMDPWSLALAIDSLISSPEVRRRLCLGAIALACEWFSWDKVILRTIEALKKDTSESHEMAR